MDQVQREEPALTLSVPDMSARIGVAGVEFVEFAADQAGAADLHRSLTSLGFQEAGRHISKHVTVYRQGDIKVVVNTEGKGLARSVFVTHGTAAYAVGLRVEDAAATVARARALGAEPFAQPVGQNELLVPAIRGISGGLIYFIDGKSELAKVWDIEFAPLQPPPVAPVGLVRFDHVGQTMQQGEMLTQLLFYIDLRTKGTHGGCHRSRRCRSQPGHGAGTAHCG
jgi:4-hydroxyphenylpyruvate dioxygenase